MPELRGMFGREPTGSNVNMVQVFLEKCGEEGRTQSMSSKSRGQSGVGFLSAFKKCRPWCGGLAGDLQADASSAHLGSEMISASGLLPRSLGLVKSTFLRYN